MANKDSALKIFLSMFLIFSFICALTVGGLGYVYFEGQKKKLAVQEAKIKELSENESAMKTRISEATEKEDKLNAENARIAQENKEFENQKNVILNQVRTSVASFESFRSESRTEIDKLSQSVEALEASKIKLTDELNSTQTLSRKEKDSLNTQVKGLTKQINEHKKREEELIKSIRVKERVVMVSETAKLHYNLGNFYFKNRQYKSAAEEYKQALFYNDTDADAHFNLAIVSDEYLGDRDTAIREYKRYMELQPQGADITKVKLRLADLGMDKEVMVAPNRVPKMEEFKSDEPSGGIGEVPLASSGEAAGGKTNVTSANKKKR